MWIPLQLLRFRVIDFLAWRCRWCRKRYLHEATCRLRFQAISMFWFVYLCCKAGCKVLTSGRVNDSQFDVFCDSCGVRRIYPRSCSRVVCQRCKIQMLICDRCRWRDWCGLWPVCYDPFACACRQVSRSAWSLTKFYVAIVVSPLMAGIVVASVTRFWYTVVPVENVLAT